jgi:hypothetical protein
MTCPDCRNEIPAPALHCPDCLSRKARKLYLKHQKGFLPGILEGIYKLTLAKPAADRTWHIRLVGDAGHAWCGEEISPQWKHRRYVRLTEDRANLCPRCTEVFERMVREIRPEVA